MKRFKVESMYRNDIANLTDERFDTLFDAVLYCRSIDNEIAQELQIKDLHEDIAIHYYEVNAAFLDGEYPEDLSFF